MSYSLRCGLVVLGLMVCGLAGCTTLREVASLRTVRFQIDRISESHLAGVRLSKLRSLEDLSGNDLLRLTTAVSEGKLPFSFQLHLQAINPASNEVNARLTKMDWTLLLEEKETVSGTFDRELVLPPGTPTDVPVRIQLDLLRFFEENLNRLVDLALAVSGEHPPQSVKLKVRPTINTKFGPITYPSPITAVSGKVGRQH